MAVILKNFNLIVLPWTQSNVIDPLVIILQRGAEPKQLAFSGALGMTLGMFPIVGVTVFLCGFAIAMLGSHCHAPTVMLANFAATPFELSLIIPFLRFGELITGGPHFALSSDAFKKVLTGRASRDVFHSIFHVLLGWLVAAPFIMALLESTGSAEIDDPGGYGVPVLKAEAMAFRQACARFVLGLISIKRTCLKHIFQTGKIFLIIFVIVCPVSCS